MSGERNCCGSFWVYPPRRPRGDVYETVRLRIEDKRSSHLMETTQCKPVKV
jgi:hypothetical protein